MRAAFGWYGTGAPRAAYAEFTRCASSRATCAGGCRRLSGAEILLETKLRAAYAKQGFPDADVNKKLKKYYRTMDRLTVLCQEIVSGGCSVADDAVFWDSWLTECN